MGVRSAIAYARQLAQLTPPGRAWPRFMGSRFDQLRDGFADEFARADIRAAALVEEANPLTTLELLPDWERVAGLPDTCAPIGGSIRERQLAIARKLAGEGGQSAAFLIAIAARIGVDIEIEEFEPFTCDSSVDGEICDDDWRFAFTVVVLPESVIFTEEQSFSEGWLTTESGCDELLRTAGIESLECLIVRAKPAHSIPLFSYPAEPEPILWFDHLSNQGAY